MLVEICDFVESMRWAYVSLRIARSCQVHVASLRACLQAECPHPGGATKPAQALLGEQVEEDVEDLEVRRRARLQRLAEGAGSDIGDEIVGEPEVRDLPQAGRVQQVGGYEECLQ